MIYLHVMKKPGAVPRARSIWVELLPAPKRTPRNPDNPQKADIRGYPISPGVFMAAEDVHGENRPVGRIPALFGEKMAKESHARVSFNKMRNYAIPMLAGITLMLLSPAVVARPVKLWTPAELFERSEIVVVGQPTEIQATGKTGTIQLGKRNPVIPVAFYSAKVRIVETIKGQQLEKEITIEYSQVDYSQLDPPGLENGPGRFRVEEGGLFLLYLNKSGEGVYVGALNGDFDDDQASKLLARKNTQDGADQPATAQEPKSEGNEKPKPESEVRPQ